MSTRVNDASHYENHHKASELENGTAHAHLVAGQHGKQEHLSGHEQSRRAQEHASDSSHGISGATVGHGVSAFGHAEIAALAYELWQARGGPIGSPEEDWFRAAEELRSRARSH